MVDSARRLLDGPDRRRSLARARFAANPFSLGAASGDPLPDGVVLWTRLAPEPLSFDPEPARPSVRPPAAPA